MEQRKSQSSIPSLKQAVEDLLEKFAKQQTLIRQLKHENKELKEQVINRKEGQNTSSNKQKPEWLLNDPKQVNELCKSIDNHISRIEKSMICLEKLQ